MKTGNPFTVMHSKRECVGYCSKNFKICEFVENKHKDNPPKPLSHNIFFDPITPRIGYVWLVREKRKFLHCKLICSTKLY